MRINKNQDRKIKAVRNTGTELKLHEFHRGVMSFNKTEEYGY